MPRPDPLSAQVRGESAGGPRTRRFSDALAAVPIVMGFIGIVLFARELSLTASLSSFGGTISLLSVLTCGLITGLLLASLVRLRSRNHPIPFTLLALIATIPSLTLLVPIHKGLQLAGPWLSGWYFAGLAVVACAEVVGPFQDAHTHNDIKNTPFPAQSNHVGWLHRGALGGASVIAIIGAALESPLILPLALMSVPLWWAAGQTTSPHAKSASIAAPWFAALAFVAAFATARLLGQDLNQGILGMVMAAFVVASCMGVLRSWPKGIMDSSGVAALALAWMVWVLGRPLPLDETPIPTQSIETLQQSADDLGTQGGPHLPLQ